MVSVFYIILNNFCHFFLFCELSHLIYTFHDSSYTLRQLVAGDIHSMNSSQVKIIYFSGTQCIQQENQHDVHITK